MHRRLRRRRRLAAETLEARLNMATLTVNTTVDNTDADQGLSLREAIALVNFVGDASTGLGGDLTAGEAAQVNTAEAFGTNDTIVFDPALVDSQIDLASRLTISRSVSIDGSNLSVISGSQNSQHFFLDGRTNGPINVKISDLQLAEGSAAGGGSLSGEIDNGRNGGSIFNDQGVLELDAVDFSSNDASSGGAIYNLAGLVTVRDSVLANNSADFGAVIINDSTGGFASFTLSQTVITGNSAKNILGTSGAIEVHGGRFEIVQSVIADNVSLFGGQFAAISGGQGAFIVLTNTAVVGNGAVDVFTDPNSFTLAQYCYFGNGAGVQGMFTVTDGVNNNIVGTTTDSSVVFYRNNQNSLYYPKANGPLIDAGDNNAATMPLDLRGFPRIVDGPDADAVATADIGAVEYHKVTPTIDIVSALNPAPFGQLVPITATVASAAGVPSGTVIFYSNGTPISTPLNLDGTGRVTTNALFPVGSANVFALYNGDAAFEVTLGGNLTQVVEKAATTTALKIGLLPGNALHLQADVSQAGVLEPYGIVEFRVDNVVVGTVQLGGGAAPLTSAFVNTGPLAAGLHSVLATYLGSPNSALSVASGAVSVGSLVVDTLVDEDDGNHSLGDLSLREAIGLANSFPGADVITFAGPGTLTLTQGRLTVASDTTISGPGANALAISGNDASQIFYIDGETNGRATVTIQDVTLTHGRAAGLGDIRDDYDTGLSGGALVNNRSDVTLRRVAVTNSTATNGAGGGLINWAGGSNMTLVESTVSGNTAFGSAPDGTGGGIYHWTGTLTVINSTVSGNTSTSAGGGIFNDPSGSLILTNVTVTGNHSGGVGGGINTSGTETLQNTIVAGNFRNAQDNDLGGDVVENAFFSLIGDPISAGGIVDGVNGNIVGKNHDNNPDTPRILWPIAEILNPTLANNGGPTLTHALVAGGPAINAGADALSVGSTDQRGLARIQGGSVDIGAFEFDPSANSPPTTIELPPAPVVREHSPGAVVGTLVVVDPDSGETFTYVVSDSRFEVVGGVLMVRPDANLAYGTGSITFTIIATDSAGQSTAPLSFTIAIRLGSVATPYHNGAERSNVDRIDGVDPADILWTSYYYTLYPNGVLPAAPDNDLYILVDVNGDGIIDPQDILYAIVDYIAAQGGEGEGAITAAAEAVPADAALHDAALAWLLWDAEVKRKERANG